MTLVTVYSPEGKEAEISARNAAEMVQHNGWRYEIKANPEAVKRAELEAMEASLEGTIKVFKESGEVFDLDRANARELLSVGGYSLKPYTAGEDNDEENHEEADEKAQAEVAEPIQVEAEEPQVVSPVDVANDSLASIAAAAGFETMDEYLASLNESPLRDLALLRYEEKVHHRASKANTITKIIELEEAALEAAKF